MEKHEKLPTLLIVLVMPLAGFGIDIIAPSLPAINNTFHTSPSTTKQAISIYIFGFGIAQLIVGILADRYGRKPTLLLSLALFSLSSLLCALCQSIHVLLFSRLLQGFAMAGMVLNVRAIFADCLHGEKLRKASIYTTTAWGMSSVAGPGIGGYLQVLLGWQANFYFLFSLAAFMFFALLLLLPETIQEKTTLNFQKLLCNYKQIFTEKKFLKNIIGLMLGFTMLSIFSVLGPFIIQHHYNYSVLFYSHNALIIGIFFLVGSFSNNLIIKTAATNTIITFSIYCIMTITVIGGIFTSIMDNAYLLCITTMLITFAIGLLYPNCSANCSEMFKDIAGIAISARGIISMVGSSLILIFISHYSINHPTMFFTIYFVLAGLLLFLWKIMSST